MVDSGPTTDHALMAHVVVETAAVVQATVAAATDHVTLMQAPAL